MSEDVSIRKMGPADADGLSACVRRCYGDSYPKRLMYEPVVLAEQLQSREYNGVVASAGAEIVGHIGFLQPTPVATIVEAGTTVVDTRFRGAGIMARLASALRDNIIAEGAFGFVHYPTTAHTVMQKASLASGGCETGMMLAYLPPEARDLTIGGSGEERLAVTVVYQPLVEAPTREIFLPDRYRDLIANFARSLGLQRTFMRGVADLTGKTKFRLSAELDGKLDRLAVEHIGEDFADVVATMANSDAALIHVDLTMNHPEIEHAVEALRANGFAFCAWLPGWNESDVLRFQRPKDPTTGELHPTLHSPHASDIVALIRSELASPIS